MKDCSTNLCCCGKEATRYSFCQDCYTRIAVNFNKLCQTLNKQHRGAGGAAICICGAGCGGTQECSALNMLKVAITTSDPKLRYSIADAIGWSSYMQDLTIK